ncbi:MAG: ATP-binding protein [Methanoregula sp.]|nr:ATP-binding protein [Methanoregula sp.]
MKPGTKMSRDKNGADASGTLRRLAEKRLGEMVGKPALPIKKEDMKKLIYELQVFQIEAEIQNEGLIQARDEVETLLERYTNLYEFAPVGYFTVDQRGTIHNVNLTGAALLGLERSLLIDRRFQVFVSQDSLPGFKAFMETVFERKTKQSCDVGIRNQNDQPIVVRIEANVAGAGEECFMAVADITERKSMERQRESLIKELEQKNAELERFTYTVSHDLKSPLITIRGFTGALEEDIRKKDSANIAKDFERINTATDSMQTLLRDLLELSRIDRIITPPEKVSFTTIAREALELLEGGIRQQGVTIRIDPDMPIVNVVHSRVREAVMNLLENGIKFMGGQPKPMIQIGVRDDQGEPVFTVKDNGIGIDPKYHGRIFNLFEKLDVKTEGTGAGLAIVKRIIEMHGGRIWVESKGVGKGSTFCFTLPGPAGKERT